MFTSSSPVLSRALVRTSIMMIAAFGAVGLSSCSLKSGSSGKDLKVSISLDSFKKFRARSAAAAPSGSALPALVPSTLDGFTCIGLNVTAPDLPATHEKQECVSSTMLPLGIRAGLVSASTGGEIAVKVASGTQRTIQVFALVSQAGCPAIEDLLTGKVDQTKFGSAIEIGRATVDLVNDATVEILPAWDATAPQKVLCLNDAITGTEGTPAPSPSPSPSPSSSASGSKWDDGKWDSAVWGN